MAKGGLPKQFKSLIFGSYVLAATRFLNQGTYALKLFLLWSSKFEQNQWKSRSRKWNSTLRIQTLALPVRAVTFLTLMKPALNCWL